MAKKFVRGVTGVDDIEKFDKTLTNVNDLISDGQNTYVHTKKGKNEFYYKVTDGVTSVNSPGGTITVEKSDDGTVKLNTNPKKVLEHDNLQVDYGISKKTSGNTTKLGIEYTKVPDGFDLNTLTDGRVRGYNMTNAPTSSTWYHVDTIGNSSNMIQKATLSVSQNTVTYIRSKINNVWGSWREQAGDKSVIDSLLADKQDALQSSLSIGVSNGRWLRQLYTNNQTYTTSNGVLKTHVKSIAKNTSVDKNEEEFNFIVKINKGAETSTFNLNSDDKTKFTNIMSAYGSNNTVNISGCVFTLSGSTLTVSTTNNTNQNYVITFSDII